MADYRYFIKVHIGFPEHRKTAGLSDRAFRVLVELWCLTARVQSDGVVTKAQLPRKSSKKVLDELASNGWLTVHDSTVQLIGYLEHQTSKAAIDDLRKVRSEAGKRGGTAKANRVASATANGKQTGSKHVAEVEVETEVEVEALPKTTTRAAAQPDRFPEFWQAYPRRDDKPRAVKAWAQAIKRADPDAIIAGAARYAADPERDQAFTKQPATWLNADAWDNGPLPPRRALFDATAKPSTTDQRFGAALALAQQYHDAENNSQPPRQIGTGR